MAYVTLSITLPDSAIAREAPAALEGRLRLLWALDEIRAGRMTRVGAAAWLGLGLDDFLARADAHGLPAMDYDLRDFADELAAIP